MKPTASTHSEGNYTDEVYNRFIAGLNSRFLLEVENGLTPVFTTDAPDLWETYLNAFPEGPERQHHNCHCCRAFVERYGSLVRIDATGAIKSVLWYDDAQEAYRPALAALAKAVKCANVTGVFLAEEGVWGTPQTGVWKHFAVVPPSSLTFRWRLRQSAHQAMAEKAMDFETVARALGEFRIEHIETALSLLRTDALYRSEKVLGQAEWLHRVHTARAAAKGSDAKRNIVWREIATAGFCHPRSSMIGSLLEDIAVGKDFEQVSRAFRAKMHPLQYQRPQAPPSDGVIAQAEKIVSQLGAAGSLARRFCRLDEIQAVWRPKSEEAPESPSVFGHLKSKTKAVAASMVTQEQTMTWEKFERTVLPTAERIEILAPELGSYSALVTAVDPDAPPILQWDSAEKRNSVSWYEYHGGSTAGHWGLLSGVFWTVEAITLSPSMWNGGNEHHGAGVLFIISGARESKSTSACLFPETLRSEFHGIRSAIEAYSNGATIAGLNEPHVAGLAATKGKAAWSVKLRVRAGGMIHHYRLDRWD